MNGRAGRDGRDGLTGLSGSSGQVGETGETGATGERGKQGERGPQGPVRYVSVRRAVALFVVAMLILGLLMWAVAKNAAENATSGSKTEQHQTP